MSWLAIRCQGRRLVRRFLALPFPSSTATALPFRVTTTGPVALAFTNELRLALTWATDAILIRPLIID